MNMPGFLFRKNFYRAFLIIWSILILTVSSIPNLNNPEIPANDWLNFRLDYLFHFLVFFILGVLVIFWKTPNKLKFSTRQLLLILLFGSLFAIIDEVHQLIIPGRRYNPIDLYCNLFGYWAGVLLMYFYIIRFLFVKHQRFASLMSKIQEQYGK